jgi:hypothetical protein
MADEKKLAEDKRNADERLRDKKAADEKYLADQKQTVAQRVAKAYEHETPTPTQEENDAAKLASLGQTPEEPPPPPEGGVTGQQRRNVEAQPAGGGYQTRSTEAPRTEPKKD